MEYFTYKDLENKSELMISLTGDNLFSDRKMCPVPTDLVPVLKDPDNVRIVLFDIYGTLLISQSGDVGTAAEKSRSGCFLKVLEKCGLFPRNVETASMMEKLFFDSIKNTHTAKKKEGISYPEVDIITIWHEVYDSMSTILESPPNPSVSLMAKLAFSYEMEVNSVCLMPGFYTLLNKIKASGITLGIISNAQFYTPLLLENITDSSLEELGFKKELCIWSYKEGIGKPSGKLFKKACKLCLEKYGVKPEEILYIGNDMRNDIFPAAGAGMQTALFAGDRRSLRMREKDPLYSYVKPDIILTELKQLTDLL